MDSAAIHVADFLRVFGQSGIDALLLDDATTRAPATQATWISTSQYSAYVATIAGMLAYWLPTVASEKGTGLYRYDVTIFSQPAWWR